MIEKSFIKAMREHFGYRPGEGLKEFSAEIKQLTDKDREDLAVEFEKVGVKITS